MIEVGLGVFIITLTTIGQVLLKLGADNKRPVFINVYVISAYITFLITILFSFQLLKTMPMLSFTVIISLNYICVMLASTLFLKEEFTRNKFLGTLLVTLGIIIFIQ